MSAALIGILSVGVALDALLLTSVRSLRAEMREDTRRIEGCVDALEQRMARLEGVLDGLREALFGRTREANG